MKSVILKSISFVMLANIINIDANHGIVQVSKNTKSVHVYKRREVPRPCLITSDCVDTAVSYLKLVKDKLSNYEKQLSRMKTQMKTGRSKAGKKGIFRGIVQRLVRAGGGNVSNLVCNGELDSAGSEKLKNLATSLLDCEGDIGTNCDAASKQQSDVKEVDGEVYLSVYCLIPSFTRLYVKNNTFQIGSSCLHERNWICCLQMLDEILLERI